MVGEFVTVTATAADVALALFASTTRAVSEYAPSVIVEVSQLAA